MTVSRSTTSLLRHLTQDTVTVNARVTPASEAAIPSLQVALLQFARDPETALGSALMSSYRIQQGSVLVRIVGVQSPPPAPAPPPRVSRGLRLCQLQSKARAFMV